MPLCSRPNGQIRNMLDLTKRLGLLSVGQATMSDLDLVAAIRTCADCDCGATCRDWLAQAPSTLKQPPSFCPDALQLARAKAAAMA